MATKPKLEVVTAIRPQDVIRRLNDIREAIAAHNNLSDKDVTIHLSADGLAIAFEFRVKKHEEAVDAKFRLAYLPGFTVTDATTAVPSTGFGHIVRGRIGG